jgi:metal-responsive CopG/Arc/MetJ family transcriptional regulator
LAKSEETKRVSVNFSQNAYNVLEDLARREGVTVSEALRKAIALNKWFVETQDSGGKILVEENGKLQRIVRI